MGLRDEAREATGGAGLPSRLERLLDALDGDEREAVIDLVWHEDVGDISNRAIADVLTKHYGDRFGTFTLQGIQRHRQKPRP
jgi:hypothetical protein